MVQFCAGVDGQNRSLVTINSLQNLFPLGSCTGRGRIRFLGSARRDCSKIFITAHPSSKSGAAANRPLRHRLLHSVNRIVFVRSTLFVFPKAKAQYVNCFSIQFLIMFSELIILLCLAASMIQLFMLDLVMFIIYLFRNLIMQLSNISTTNKMFIVETN